MTRYTCVLSLGYRNALHDCRASPEQSFREKLHAATAILHKLPYAMESGRPERPKGYVAEARFPGEALAKMGCLLEKHVFVSIAKKFQFKDPYGSGSNYDADSWVVFSATHIRSLSPVDRLVGGDTTAKVLGTGSSLAWSEEISVSKEDPLQHF